MHTGRAIQFANLALRNAWFAGGVEWNIGTRGHSPTTCSPCTPPSCTRTTGSRCCGCGSSTGCARSSSRSTRGAGGLARAPGGDPHPEPQSVHAVPMYSVEQRGRAPKREGASGRAGGFRRSQAMTRRPRPGRADRRGRRRLHLAGAESPGPRLLFRPRRRPAALDARGGRGRDGLAMLSTARLRGRKLFVCEGPGGHRWQDCGPRPEPAIPRSRQDWPNPVPAPRNACWRRMVVGGGVRQRPRRHRPRALGGLGRRACGHCAARVDELLSARRPGCGAGVRRLLGGCAADPVAERRHRLGRARGAAARANRDAVDPARTGTPFAAGHGHHRPAAVA